VTSHLGDVPSLAHHIELHPLDDSGVRDAQVQAVAAPDILHRFLLVDPDIHRGLQKVENNMTIIIQMAMTTSFT
jgi:hypothetical protein